MTKKFLVSLHNGAAVTVEARSLTGAMKKSGWLPAEISSVSVLKPAPTSWCSLIGNETIKVTFPEGTELVGLVEPINAIFATMGYGEIEIATNMMSGRRYIEAVETPNYCSPSSEAYWSM